MKGAKRPGGYTTQLEVKWSAPISESESEALGLAWREHYVLLAVDHTGNKFSLVGADVEYGRFAMSARMPEGTEPRQLNLDKFPIMFRGWLPALEQDVDTQGLEPSTGDRPEA